MNIGDTLTINFNKNPALKAAELLGAVTIATIETNRRLRNLESQSSFLSVEAQVSGGTLLQIFDVADKRGQGEPIFEADNKGGVFKYWSSANKGHGLQASDNENEIIESLSNALFLSLPAKDQRGLANYVDPKIHGQLGR